MKLSMNLKQPVGKIHHFGIIITVKILFRLQLNNKAIIWSLKSEEKLGWILINMNIKAIKLFLWQFVNDMAKRTIGQR